jgi:hypothetical protein
MVRRECGSDRPRGHPVTASGSHLMQDDSHEPAVSRLIPRLAPIIITVGTQPSLPSCPSPPDWRRPLTPAWCPHVPVAPEEMISATSPWVTSDVAHTDISRKTREAEEQCTRPACRGASPDAYRAAARAVRLSASPPNRVNKAFGRSGKRTFTIISILIQLAMRFAECSVSGLEPSK